MKALSAAKTLLRGEHLQKQRALAKNDPLFLQRESAKLCLVLYERIQALRSSLQAASSLFLCAFLPLYYEVDLQPLVHRLWRDSQNDDMAKVTVFFPLVLTPEKPTDVSSSTASISIPIWQRLQETAVKRRSNAMIFVEAFGEEDLKTKFERRGRYRIMEPNDGVMEELFSTYSDSKSHKNIPLRHFIACDDYDTLFAECKKPMSLIELNQLPPTTEGSVCMLVLTPGVLFDRFGGRLGKGGGYYDRFLQYCQKATNVSLLVWGAGIEMQLMPEGIRLPVCLPGATGNGIQDFFMDGIATPTGFVCCPSHVV